MDDVEILPTDPAGPLQPGQFRLCWLQPSNSGMPQGKLAVFQIDNIPTYQALSYTWGYPYREAEVREGAIDLLPDELCFEEPVVEFTCQGRHPGKLIPNLYNALHQLLQLGLAGWVWIDAICIRQHDLDEKAAQIKMMAEIFSSAQEVTIWLGHKVGLTPAVTKLVRRLHTLFPREDDIQALPGERDIIGPGLFDDDLCEQRLGIANMVWEAVDGTRTRSCRRGTSTLGHGAVQLGGTGQRMSLCRSAWVEWTTRRDDYGSGQWNMNRGAASVVRLWETRSQRNSVLPIPGLFLQQVAESIHDHRLGFLVLEQQLIGGAAFDCTNPLDRVYAVLARAEKRTGIKFASLIEPDYSQPCEELYISMTTLILEESQTLDLLAYAPSEATLVGNSTLPSWVPDYRFKGKHKPIWVRYDEDEDIFSAASGITPQEHVLVIREEALECLGVWFDTVDTYHNTSKKINDFNSTGPSLDFCKSLSATDAYPRVRPLEVIWRSCIYNHRRPTGDPQASPASLECSFLAFLAFNLVGDAIVDKVSTSEWQRRRLQFEQDLACYELSHDPECWFDMGKLDSWRDEVISSEGDASRISRTDYFSATKFSAPWMYEYDRTGVGCPLFMTKRGLLGVGYLGMQQGDQIWVLYGACTPFILRPTDVEDEFILVGDCFMLNHMHGEIMAPRYGLTGTEQHIKIV